MARNEVWQAARKLQIALAVVRQREPVVKVCRRFGVSRQSAYKYARGFRAEGIKGLEERSRGRRTGGWARRWRQQILSMRRVRPTWGARKLRWWLRQRHPHRPLPAERTVQRWLRLAGVVRRRRHRRHGLGLPPPKPRHARHSNHIWSVDHKGWFLLGRGQKVLPLTVRDMYSRYVLAVTPVGSIAAGEARRVFQRLFARYGLPRVIRSDRGTPFCGAGPHGLTQLSLWWYRLGIRAEFVHRQRRVDNNAHEQMHAVLHAEVAARPARTLAAQHRRLESWRRYYNHARPHEALGMCTPASCYHPDHRPRPRLRLPRYPAGWLVRRVKSAGQILVDQKLYGIGRAFHRLPVGLQPVRNRPHRVYFGRLLLGHIDLATDRFLRPLAQPKP